VQLEQTFTLPFPLEAVWPAFSDASMLVSCMPGAALQGEPCSVVGGEDIDLMFTVKLGPIVGAFHGKGEVRRDDATKSGAFSGTGADRKSGSRVKGEAKFSLIEISPNESRIEVNVDYSLTGTLAQFSRGAIVKELAAALTRDFAANLRERIAASQTISAAMGEETRDRERDAASTAMLKAGQPLQAGRLLWRVLWARVVRWFGHAGL
jgi:uncharacterized protein